MVNVEVDEASYEGVPEEDVWVGHLLKHLEGVRGFVG